MRLGDFVVLLFDARPEWPDTPALLRLYASEVDRVCARGLAAGAVEIAELRRRALNL